MELIQDSEYILYNAMAENVIRGLSKPLKKLTEKCEVLAAKYARLKASFLESGTYDELGLASKNLREVELQLVKLLAIQNRIERIIQRNQSRQEMFKERFDIAGIYNFQVDKKELMAAVLKEEKNISEETLNLNPMNNGDVCYKFFAGKILVFVNGKLDFSNEQNQEVLKEADADFFHEMVEMFPSSVATIPDELFSSSRIKENVLKESVLYAASKIKTQSIADSNKDLGGLLSNCGEITDIAKFAQELKNYLNVVVKQSLKSHSPELGADIDESLKCNEASEFLPRSKRIAVLANGLASDAPKTEAEESEEVRKEQEEEAKEAITREELLDLLLADEEEEQELQEDIEEISKVAEEERRLNEEREEEKKLEELEKQLEMGLKKNETVDE